MRRAFAILFAVWVAAACAAANGGAVAPATTAAPTTAETSAAPVAALPREDRSLDERFLQGPDAMAIHAAQQAPALTPEAKRAVDILSPSVTVVPAPYGIDALPTRAASAAELADLRGSVGGWVDSFIAMLDRQRHPQAGVDPALDLRSMFADTRLSSVVMRSLASGNIYGQPTLTDAGWTLDGAVMRAWGSPAYLDVTVKAVDHGPSDVPLLWRLRLQQTGFWYRVIDLREPVSGDWVIGTAPRYSALELETEMRNAVGWYLNNESYSSFRPTSAPMSLADAPFFRARTAAIEDLNRAYAADQFRERYFENVRSSIELFQPAWFGGDGIVTVSVTGRVVETRNNGTQTATSFVQRLKFLRTLDSWIAVDAQNDDGSWASDGNLALAEVARPHG
jgi:hypothetical protein